MATQFRVEEELGERMTQSELARLADVHYVTVNRLCRNATERVDLKTLDRVSAVLGCEPGDLLERTPEKRKRVGQKRRRSK